MKYEKSHSSRERPTSLMSMKNVGPDSKIKNNKDVNKLTPCEKRHMPTQMVQTPEYIQKDGAMVTRWGNIEMSLFDEKQKQRIAKQKICSTRTW